MHPLATLALDELIADAQVNTDAAWREQRQRLNEAQAFDPPLPSTLQADLRPYQREGYEWLARLSQWGAGACLADDMGLGKTVQTLALLLHRAPEGPALVVAPTSVVANWVDEARRFAPTLNVTLYGGTAASRDGQLDGLGPFDLVVTSYGLLQNDIGKLAELPWRSAVLDEAQAIKNPATKRAKAARLLKADFRLITTGTPIQNNLIDLHSLFSFINPGLLGSLEHYRRHFASPIERGGNADARSRLRRLIAPFMLRPPEGRCAQRAAGTHRDHPARGDVAPGGGPLRSAAAAGRGGSGDRAAQRPGRRGAPLGSAGPPHPPALGLLQPEAGARSRCAGQLQA